MGLHHVNILQSDNPRRVYVYFLCHWQILCQFVQPLLNSRQSDNELVGMVSVAALVEQQSCQIPYLILEADTASRSNLPKSLCSLQCSGDMDALLIQLAH